MSVEMFQALAKAPVIWTAQSWHRSKWPKPRGERRSLKLARDRPFTLPKRRFLRQNGAALEAQTA